MHKYIGLIEKLEEAFPKDMDFTYFILNYLCDDRNFCVLDGPERK
jgi:hypothetical protein